MQLDRRPWRTSNFRIAIFKDNASSIDKKDIILEPFGNTFSCIIQILKMAAFLIARHFDPTRRVSQAIRLGERSAHF